MVVINDSDFGGFCQIYVALYKDNMQICEAFDVFALG